MARLDEYIFGFHKGKVKCEDVSDLANIFLKLGISSRITPDGGFSLSHRDAAEFSAYARSRIRFELYAPGGLYGLIASLRYSYGIIAALILSIFVFAFSSTRVWDVRVSGNERLTDSEIEAALFDLGLEIGSPWRKVDKNAIENEMLSENSDIAWIAVNRRGTVAYVNVIESENVGVRAEDESAFSNIVATRDGVIEEITVDRGVAAVKVGDVVRKGQVLISGVVENEKGVTLVCAKGVVRASCVTNVSAEAPEKSVERVLKSQKLAHMRLVLFKFSINLFKNYGNSENGCDIIKENRKFTLFNEYRLPVRIERAYIAEYEEVERTRSAEEMTSAAERELDAMIYSMFKDADVIKLRTEGAFVDGAYRISARVVYSADIGEKSVIEIS